MKRQAAAVQTRSQQDIFQRHFIGPDMKLIFLSTI